MIDHNPEYEMAARERENGFRDATANEIRQLREDENYRYRDRQRFENGSKEEGTVPTKYPRDFHHLVEDGKRLQERTQSEVAAENAANFLISIIIYAATGLLLYFIFG